MNERSDDDDDINSTGITTMHVTLRLMCVLRMLSKYRKRDKEIERKREFVKKNVSLIHGR